MAVQLFGSPLVSTLALTQPSTPVLALWGNWHPPIQLSFVGEIAHFPPNLLMEHTNWHMKVGNPGAGGRVHAPGTPGSGVEFLEFHHHFLQEFHQWFDRQPGHSSYDIQPWTQIPAELKTARAGWNATLAAAENRIVHDPLSFRTEDDLGRFIETTVHNWLHGAAATVYNDNLVGDVMTAPKSTYFYKIHGLIEKWLADWRSAQLFHSIIGIAG